MVRFSCPWQDEIDGAECKQFAIEVSVRGERRFVVNQQTRNKSSIGFFSFFSLSCQTGNDELRNDANVKQGDEKEKREGGARGNEARRHTARKWCLGGGRNKTI